MLTCLAKIRSDLSVKELKGELLYECLGGFANNFLADQERSLIMSLTNDIKDLVKVKDFSKKLAKQNEQLNQTELAVLNILEDSRELEEAIRDERDKARAIISSMGEGLLVIDKNYKIVLLNNICEKNLGIFEKDILGKDIRDVIKIDNGKNHTHELDIFKNIFKLGEIMEVKLENDVYYHVVFSDKKFPVAMVAAPLKHGEEISGIVIIFRDITREKRFDEARSSFISVASHQIRTPLTAVRWYTEMLKGGDAGPLTDEQKNFIEQIYGATLRLHDTLNTILSLSKIESGETKINFVKINIIQVVKGIIKEFEPLINEKKLKLKFENDAGESLEIETDQSMFNQIFTNLLSNSIRYTSEGGSIEIKISGKNNEALFSVKDNGIGIPEDQKGKIFEKFFRAENAVMKVADGSGLGLTLAKNLTELLKGKIWFESQEGKGTAFYFSLPKIINKK
ncbi:PAS domain S-box protein [Candidatus Wolfebacteria bacterium]|nr:PAS domain S-box protein [Candidatus Wolfebacteria bacterium]